MKKENLYNEEEEDMKKRQGDILFVKIEKIPERMKVKQDNIIAEGEATGHKHLLVDGLLYQDERDRLFVNVEHEIATIIHNEHKPVTLPKGNYKVVRQREYEPKNWRIVSD